MGSQVPSGQAKLATSRRSMALMGKPSTTSFSFPSPSGRGEPYLLKRPNVFVGSASDGVLEAGDRLLSINNRPTEGITHVEAQNIFRNSGTLAELEVARSDPEMISSRPGEEAEVLQAKQLLADTLSPLLVPGRPRGKGIQGFQGTHQSPPSLPRSNNVPHHSIQDVQISSHNDEVPIDDQPYRTTPLVLPHAKTIHDTVPPAKFLNQHQHTEGQQPYRSSTVALPAPRTINDMAPGRGAPVYQQYRGPQFNTQMAKPAQKQMGLPPTHAYNSPVPLYSQDNLAEAMAENPGIVQTNKPALPTVNTATISKPHESETFRMILESEMGGARNHAGIGSKQFDRQLSGQDRPGSQQSDRSSDAGRPGLDPVLKNNSINQSASFKKVMYSVMGETEF